MIRLESSAVIERRLSASEYFHASFGCGPDDPRPFVTTYVFEGDGTGFDIESWRVALAKACAANSGSHLRLSGTSFFAGWKSNGERPRLRLVEETDWDGMSQVGAGFIDAVPLSIRRGPTVELLLVNNSPRGKLVIIRALHAVMDGRGTLHFLADIFRAMRGEAPVGTNASFSDSDLMRHMPKPTLPASSEEKSLTERLTGPPEGNSREDIWKRVYLETSGKGILGRTAQIVAEYLHLRSDDLAAFSIPVDLRPRLPGVSTTTNLFGVVLVRLKKGESATDFRRKIKEQLDARMDTFYFRGQGLVKLLPRSTFHWLIWKVIGLYNRRRPMITAGISNQGRLEAQTYSCDGFKSRTFIGIPYPGRTDLVLTGMGDHIEMTVRMPEVFASGGRLEHFIGFFSRRMKELDNH